MKTNCLSTGTAILTMLVTFAVTSPAQAMDGMDVDLRGGMYTDAEAPALGGGLLMNVGDNGWYFNPNLEMVFKDNDTDASVNGDFHYDFPNTGSLSTYLGVGPALLLNDGNNDLGVNVIGGIAGKRGEVRPFAQLKGIISDNNEVALMGGLRF